MAAFDPIAFAMGKAGASRDLVSALMGGNGGGGVPGDLETSGWVLELGANTTVVGNVITLAVGDYNHHCYLAPPESVRAGRTFEAGDVLIMAVKITDVFQQLQARANSVSVGAMTSATGLFTGNGTTMNRKASETGSDVLTWTFTNQATGARLAPLPSDKTSYATCEITGLSFNGTVIFGTV